MSKKDDPCDGEGKDAEVGREERKDEVEVEVPRGGVVVEDAIGILSGARLVEEVLVES